MKFDKAGYPYIKENDHYYRLSQSGGATVAEIDANFDNPDLVNPLEWKTDKVEINQNPVSKKYELKESQPRWEPKFDHWYHQLDIDPEYLLTKCRDKQVELTPEQVSALSSPFARDYYDTKARDPSGEEYLSEDIKFTENLPDEIRKPIEDYSKVTKEKEKESYQNCKIAVPESNLQNKKAILCNEFMCRDAPLMGENGKIIENPRVSKLEDFEALEKSGALSEEKTKSYQYCMREDLYCNAVEEDARVSTSPGKPFMHFKNAGGGACLFIAVAQYLKFAQTLDVFPDYKNNTANATNYKYIVPWKSTVIAYKSGHILRLRAIDWGRKNLNVLMGTQTLGQEIAIYMLSTADYQDVNDILAHIGLDSLQIYNQFIESNPGSSSILRLKPVGTNKKEINSIFTHARNIVNTEDAKLVNNDDLIPAINNFVNYLSQRYLDAMSYFSSYGGNIEIFILSQLLQKNIHIWANHDIQTGVVTDTYLRYPYMSHNSNVRTNDTINILYFSQHYETILPWKTNPNDLTKKKCSDLKAILRELKLPVSGKKAELIERISTSDYVPKVSSNPVEVFMHHYKIMNRNVALQLFIDLYLDKKIELTEDIRKWLESSLTTHVDDDIDFTTISNLMQDIIMRDIVPTVTDNDYVTPVDDVEESPLSNIYRNSIKKYFRIEADPAKLTMIDLMKYKHGDNLFDLYLNGDISIHNQILVASLMDLGETSINHNFLTNFTKIKNAPIKFKQTETYHNLVKLLIYYIAYWHVFYTSFMQRAQNGNINTELYWLHISANIDKLNPVLPKPVGPLNIIDFQQIRDGSYKSLENIIELIDNHIDFNGNVSLPDTLTFIPEDSDSPSPSPSPSSPTPEQMIVRELIEVSWQGSSDDIDYLLQQHIDGLDIDKITNIFSLMTTIGEEHTRSNFDKFVRDNT